MSGYKRKPKATTTQIGVIGMLHIVEIRMVTKGGGEKIKQRLLLVGCEAADIERKVKWLYEFEKYEQFAVTGIEKVREKVHVLSTSTTDNVENVADATIKRAENTEQVHGLSAGVRGDARKLYAVGVTTTILANDEDHAVMKVGKALISRVSKIKSVEGPKLSANSVLQVEEIAMSSGYATARDVGSESNKAHFVRG